ncbi:RNA methyltransferase [Chlamydia abortus]|uniref:RNA methyltransferase n=1 Tax=Chlamydia abortus TaxID=83555 RepID=UPI0011EFCC12|nr:RNA methyltransferase [Chlamydia abortus]QEM73592.1 RNA methyltransferase [Chlamydia abortus]CAG9046421.1 23S rRNA (uridine(2479)-2'-O)-methyltransferase [Chlamydia abortus]
MEFIGKNNPKVKEAVALKHNRSRKGPVFLLEGFREIQKALASGYECERIFCGTRISEKEQAFLHTIQKLPLEKVYCTEETLSKLSYKEHHDNFIAVMKKRWWSREEFLAQKRNPLPFYLIIEQVEKPGNVGAILRIADGVGADGVILCDPIVDVYNPNVIRSSLGTVFTLPIWSATLDQVQQVILEEKWHAFVTSPRAHTMYFCENYNQPLVLVFGSEKDGLTASWLRGNFSKISLPMLGQADSLNLSTAVSAVAYEVVRQRWEA